MFENMDDDHFTLGGGGGGGNSSNMELIDNNNNMMNPANSSLRNFNLSSHDPFTPALSGNDFAIHHQKHHDEHAGLPFIPLLAHGSFDFSGTHDHHQAAAAAGPFYADHLTNQQRFDTTTTDDYHTIKRRRSSHDDEISLGNNSNPPPNFMISAGGENRTNRNNNGHKRRKKNKSEAAEVEKPREVVHVRARRGEATDSHSLAERLRREKINGKLRCLQELVPGCYKTMGMSVMLDITINYIQSLQSQIEFLSMKLSAASMFYDFNSAEMEAFDTIRGANEYEGQVMERMGGEGGYGDLLQSSTWPL